MADNTKLKLSQRGGSVARTLIILLILFLLFFGLRALAGNRNGGEANQTGQTGESQQVDNSPSIDGPLNQPEVNKEATQSEQSTSGPQQNVMTDESDAGASGPNNQGVITERPRGEEQVDDTMLYQGVK